MTAKELIDELVKYPPNTEVKLDDVFEMWSLPSNFNAVTFEQDGAFICLTTASNAEGMASYDERMARDEEKWGAGGWKANARNGFRTLPGSK